MKLNAAVIAGIVLSSISAFSAPPKNLKPGDGIFDKDGKKLTRAEVQEILYRRNGGKLKVPGIQKGSITYVNCDNAVKVDWLKKNADVFAKTARIEINVVDGEFDINSPKIVGNASLFVVSNKNLPSLLVAPEQKWVLVNVYRLKQGRGEKPAFFEARVHKELTRGFAMLCGATSSNYPQSLTGCVTNPDDLDKFPDCRLPVDVVGRFEEYLKGYGVIPYQLKTYRMAVKEGWAPAPTNDVQKAIWDKVHAMPTAPIKIKPETKKVRE